jgi:hypothetical protein
LRDHHSRSPLLLRLQLLLRLLLLLRDPSRKEFFLSFFKYKLSGKPT